MAETVPTIVARIWFERAGEVVHVVADTHATEFSDFVDWLHGGPLVSIDALDWMPTKSPRTLQVRSRIPTVIASRRIVCAEQWRVTLEETAEARRERLEDEQRGDW